MTVRNIFWPGDLGVGGSNFHSSTMYVVIQCAAHVAPVDVASRGWVAGAELADCAAVGADGLGRALVAGWVLPVSLQALIPSVRKTAANPVGLENYDQDCDLPVRRHPRPKPLDKLNTFRFHGRRVERVHAQSPPE